MTTKASSPHGGRLRLLSGEVASRVRSLAVILDLPGALDAVMANSVDSGATEMMVVVNIGRLGLVVRDNGCGIHPDDVGRVGERHMTTKVQSVDCVSKVASRGFRGEGLCSIGSISVMTIKTRSCGFNGTYMTRIHNGERVIKCVKVDEGRIEGESGTEVRVEQMFHNTPVRFKHLQQLQESKTLQKIRDLVFEYAMGNPKLAITVARESESGQMSSICQVTPRCRSDLAKYWCDTLNQVYGMELAGRFEYATHTSTSSKESVLISTLPLQTKSFQFVFINGRRVTSQLSEQVRKELSCGKFEYTEGHIEHALTTNNVSPRKGKKGASIVGSTYSKHPLSIVDVWSDNAIRNFENGQPILLDEELKCAISGIHKIFCDFRDMTLHRGQMNEDHTARRSEIESAVIEDTTVSNRKTQSSKGKELASTVGNASSYDCHDSNELPQRLEDMIKRRKLITHNDDLDINTDDAVTIKQEEQTPRDLLTNCSVIAQVDDKFILIKSKVEPKLYIVDQHACDERIRVEELYKQLIEMASQSTQSLAVPLKTNVSADAPLGALELLNTYSKELENWGIKFTTARSNNESGNVTFTHLPELMHCKVDDDNSFVVRSIMQYAHDLQDKVKLTSLNRHQDWFLNMQAMPTILTLLLNSKACRSAIMFGQTLSKFECQLLVQKLAQCKQPFQCAHGRPSVIPLCNYTNL